MLRARKPEVEEERLKVIVYSEEGVGKTHFCCSFPDTYYIDSEGINKYKHFVEMIIQNKGVLVYLTELSEIITEVRALLGARHTYKTLVIDSLSFPYAWLSQVEAERLSKKKESAEGTEFGANLAKAKRLVFQLGILLSRLDMNIIVTTHEKIKYENGVEVGSTYDTPKAMAHSLGSVWNLKQIGKTTKLFVKKSRYPVMKSGEVIDFDDGYEVVKNIFGESIFKREVIKEELATDDQIKQFRHLEKILNISEEQLNKILTNGKSTRIEELSKEFMQKVIIHCEQQIKGEDA